VANLIYTADIENFNKTGEKVYFIEDKAIITPAAKDLAKKYGIQFSTVNPAQKQGEVHGSTIEHKQVADEESVVNMDYDLRSIREACNLNPQEFDTFVKKMLAALKRV